MATRFLARSLLTSKPSLSSAFSHSCAAAATSSSAVLPNSSSFLFRLRPLVAVASASYFRRLLPATSTRAFSTQQTATSLSDPNPNWSNRPPKETILLDGCDFEHWLVVVEKPEGDPTRDEIIDIYIKTLAQVLGGSEEEARMKIYSVSTRHYYAFGALVSEELSYKLKELPKVRWVLPDSYLDVKNKDYGGEPFINGQAVPYDARYHEEWVRNNARANERNRRNDRPRNFDRSRNFERRRDMQGQNSGGPPGGGPPGGPGGNYGGGPPGGGPPGGPGGNYGGGPGGGSGGPPPNAPNSGPNMGGNFEQRRDVQGQNSGGPPGVPGGNYGGGPGGPGGNYGGGPGGNYGGGPGGGSGGPPPYAPNPGPNMGGQPNYGGGPPPNNPYPNHYPGGENRGFGPGPNAGYGPGPTQNNFSPNMGAGQGQYQNAYGPNTNASHSPNMAGRDFPPSNY